MIDERFPCASNAQFPSLRAYLADMLRAAGINRSPTPRLAALRARASSQRRR